MILNFRLPAQNSPPGHSGVGDSYRACDVGKRKLECVILEQNWFRSDLNGLSGTNMNHIAGQVAILRVITRGRVGGSRTRSVATRLTSVPNRAGLVSTALEDVACIDSTVSGPAVLGARGSHMAV